MQKIINQIFTNILGEDTQAYDVLSIYIRDLIENKYNTNLYGADIS
jgi:hypothetical protein